MVLTPQDAAQIAKDQLASQQAFYAKQLQLEASLSNRSTGVSPGLIGQQYDLAGQILNTKLGALNQTTPLLASDYNLQRQMATLQEQQQARDLGQARRNYADQTMAQGGMGSAGYASQQGAYTNNLAGMQMGLHDQLGHLANQFQQQMIGQRTNISDLQNQIAQNAAARQVALAHNAVGLAGDPNFALNKSMSINSISQASADDRFNFMQNPANYPAAAPSNPFGSAGSLPTFHQQGGGTLS